MIHDFALDRLRERITQAGLREIEVLLREDQACRPVVYVGSTTLKQDRQLREDLASGKINIILTVKKADKGLDLPSLDYLILARPANNEAFIIQISGRIVRSLPGKPTPVILDLVDNPMTCVVEGAIRGLGMMNILRRNLPQV